MRTVKDKRIKNYTYVQKKKRDRKNVGTRYFDGILTILIDSKSHFFTRQITICRSEIDIE